MTLSGVTFHSLLRKKGLSFELRPFSNESARAESLIERLKSEWANLRLGRPLLQGTLMGFNEIANRTYDNITESDIGVIGNGL